MSDKGVLVTRLRRSIKRRVARHYVPEDGRAVVTHHRLPALRVLTRSYRAERDRRKAIDAVCRGYSREAHWTFFQSVLREPSVRRVLILGVYHGRDIAYVSSILDDFGRTDVDVVGVDKFDDSACADWPSHLRSASWFEAGFGAPPELSRALENLKRLGHEDRVRLVRALAEDFLATTRESFDLIYIDTSHDYDTTRRTIELAIDRLSAGGFVAGDDFSDDGTWGVASAVRDCFSRFELFDGWIWLARATDRRHPGQA